MSTAGRRLVALGAVGLPLGALVLLGTQAWLAANADYPDTTGFEIAGTVEGGSGPPLRLAVLGDSTAAGVGAGSAETALPMLIAQRVAAALQRDVEVHGHGVSGARTREVLDDQVPALVGADVDAVVIVIGANDVTHLTPPWRLRSDTAALLRETVARGRAPVVLGGIPLFSGATNIAQPLRSVVDAYADVLRTRQADAATETSGAVFVDISRLASPRFAGVPEAMSADDFHPSEVGYGFWADALAPAVVDAVGP